jgi:hypothetical protein
MTTKKSAYDIARDFQRAKSNVETARYKARSSIGELSTAEQKFAAAKNAVRAQVARQKAEAKKKAKLLNTANFVNSTTWEAQTYRDSLPPVGRSMRVYKYVRAGMGYAVLELLIPAHAQRIKGTDDCDNAGNLGDHKCRASEAFVVGIVAMKNMKPGDRMSSPVQGGLEYKVGTTVKAANWNPKPETCSHGIHFYLTKQRAAEKCGIKV